MPHFFVEYSTNIQKELAVSKLLERLTEAAVETGVFPLAGVRCRALPRTQYRVADGHEDNAFVHVQFRVGAGRKVDVLRKAGDSIFAALSDHVDAIFDERPLTLSFEVTEIHPDLNFKKSNIRDHMAARGTGEGKK